MTIQTMVPDASIGAAYDRHDEAPASVPGDAALPMLPTLPFVDVAVGSTGIRVEEHFAATLGALGFTPASRGHLDLAPLDGPPAGLTTHPAGRLTEPLPLHLAGPNLVERGRAALGQPAYDLLRQGHSFSETASLALGGQGKPVLAALAAAAEEPRYADWIRRLLQPYRPPPGRGLERFVAHDERPRVTAVVFLTSCGSVGGGLGLETVYRLWEAARVAGVDVDIYLIVIDGEAYGHPDSPVHELISSNVQRFWAEAREVVDNGRLRVGPRMVTLNELLFGPGRILRFAEAPVDPRIGQITSESREGYFRYIGLTVALAFATGAIGRAEAAENAEVAGSSVVRTVRLAGQGIDRWAVAGAARSQAETAIVTRWHELLTPTN